MCATSGQIRCGSSKQHEGGSVHVRGKIRLRGSAIAQSCEAIGEDCMLDDGDVHAFMVTGVVTLWRRE